MAVGNLITRSGFDLDVKVKTLVITYTTPSGGPFEYGETVTGGTSSATGVVIYDDTTNSELLVSVTSGTFAGAETITGTSSATATTSGVPAIGYGAGWVNVVRVRDTFSVNRSRNSTPIEDFDTAEEDFVDQIRGNQSADASFTVNLVPGGASYQQLEGAMDYNLTLTLKRVQTDRDGTNTRTRYYTGGVTGFNETDSVGDASTVAVTFTLDDVSQADPTV